MTQYDKPIYLIGRVFDCVKFAREHNIVKYKIINTRAKLRGYVNYRFINVMPPPLVQDDPSLTFVRSRAMKDKQLGVAEEYYAETS